MKLTMLNLCCVFIAGSKQEIYTGWSITGKGDDSRKSLKNIRDYKPFGFVNKKIYNVLVY